MPKLPWKKWFFQDWLSDPHLSMCSPATRGIWKDLLSNMVLAETYEFLIDPVGLSRICRCSQAELNDAIEELIRTKTAEHHEQNGNKYIRCRRLQREHILSEKRSKAGRASGASRTNGQHLSASASVSASDSDSLSEFDAFWSRYPRKVGKGAAIRAWEKQCPPLDKCLEALDWQTKSEGWTKDNGQFIPHPSTWINQSRWLDEPERPTSQRQSNPQAKFNGVYHVCLSHLVDISEKFPNDDEMFRAEYEELCERHSGMRDAVDKAYLVARRKRKGVEQ